MPPLANQDTRTPRQSVRSVMRSFERLEKIKRDLIKAGQLRGDATPAQVIQALRELVPEDMG